MTPLDAIRRALDASRGSAKAFQAELAEAGFVVVSAARAAKLLDAMVQAEDAEREACAAALDQIANVTPWTAEAMREAAKITIRARGTRDADHG